MEFQIGKYKYRTKELNAVEAFAMRTRLVFDDFDGSLEAINLVLEHLEVEIAGQWLPVKEKGKEIYYPDVLLKDYAGVRELVTRYLNDYFKPLF
jgi:hypothetical protein